MNLGNLQKYFKTETTSFGPEIINFEQKNNNRTPLVYYILRNKDLFRLNQKQASYLIENTALSKRYMDRPLISHIFENLEKQNLYLTKEDFKKILIQTDFSLYGIYASAYSQKNEKRDPLLDFFDYSKNYKSSNKNTKLDKDLIDYMIEKTNNINLSLIFALKNRIYIDEIISKEHIYKMLNRIKINKDNKYLEEIFDNLIKNKYLSKDGIKIEKIFEYYNKAEQFFSQKLFNDLEKTAYYKLFLKDYSNFEKKKINKIINSSIEIINIKEKKKNKI